MTIGASAESPEPRDRTMSIAETPELQPPQPPQEQKVVNVKTGYDENPAINLDPEGNQKQDVSTDLKYIISCIRQQNTSKWQF
jgi:hypothetical protein